MARTWFAGSASAPIDPPPRAAMTNTDHDPAPSNQSVPAKNKSHGLDSPSDGPLASTTSSTSSQQEPSAQPAKKPSDTSTILTKLIGRHSKPNEPQTAANPISRDPRLPEPAAMMDAFAPSPSAPPCTPTAHMVTLPSDVAATTTTAAATTTPDGLTTFPSGPGPSTMGALNSEAFFPAAAPTFFRAAAPTSLIPSSLPILPSQPLATPKKRPQQTSTPKSTPQITLTPAPATASSAFRDPALASHVQNSKFLSPPTKQQTNGVKKRQYIKKKDRCPLKSSSTPEPVPGEKKRGPGRPRNNPNDEQPPQQERQHRPPPEPRTVNNTQSSSHLSAVSTLPTEQQQTLLTPYTKPNPTQMLCSEKPDRWPGRNVYVASLARYNARPETYHSEPIRACANRAAHQDKQHQHRPHPHQNARQQPAQAAHGVCTACRHCAYRHLKATRSDLPFGSAFWPLCQTCGDIEMRRVGAPGQNQKKNGCSCFSDWLCFSCLTEVVERRGAMNRVEAEARMRTLVGEPMMDGDVQTILTGWACECGEDLGPTATVMKCVGCQGLKVGQPDPAEVAAREEKLRKKALAWT